MRFENLISEGGAIFSIDPASIVWPCLDYPLNEVIKLVRSYLELLTLKGFIFSSTFFVTKGVPGLLSVAFSKVINT